MQKLESCYSKRSFERGTSLAANGDGVYQKLMIRECAEETLEIHIIVDDISVLLFVLKSVWS